MMYTHGTTTQPRTQLLVAPASQTRVAGKHEKTLSDGINEPVSNFDAAAFFRDVIPNAVKFS
jgi:hypothetical protein